MWGWIALGVIGLGAWFFGKPATYTLYRVDSLTDKTTWSVMSNGTLITVCDDMHSPMIITEPHLVLTKGDAVVASTFVPGSLKKVCPDWAGV